MITLIKMTILMLVSTLIKHTNPVKMGMVLMVLSAMMFLTLSMEKGNIWLPSIFFMLFMGGILIMFMILSSLSPNEKPMKMKTSFFMTILICFIFFNLNEEQAQEMTMEVKSILNSFYTVSSMTILVFLYFLCFISVLSKTKSTLRTSVCQ